MKQDDLNMRKILESGALAFNSGDEPASGYTQANRVQLKPYDDNDADDLPGDTVTIEIDNEIYELTPDEVALIKMITSKRNDERLGIGDEDSETQTTPYSIVDSELQKIRQYVAAGKKQGHDFRERAKDHILAAIGPVIGGLDKRELSHIHHYIDKTLDMYVADRKENPLRGQY